MRSRGVALVCASVLVTALCTLDAQSGKPAADGLLRSELSLNARTAVIAYAPNLKANTGPTKTRNRIGELETTGPLRLGTIELGARSSGTVPASTGNQPPPTIRYTLWSESSQNEWTLQITDAADTALGVIALERRAAATPSPNLLAAFVAESFTTGQLLLRWGAFEAAVPVEFVNPSRRRTTENPGVNQTINRRHDEDTSALSRARLLEQRNETALTVPSGARVSISFQRSTAATTVPRPQNARGLNIDRPDFARLATTPAGTIVLLTESPVPRLRTEIPLRFGKTMIATGNQVVGFPGSYGLWLKRVANGWRLVFNHEPDAWGSQHDAKFDAAEIDLAHSDGHAADRPFAINLIPAGPDRGRLVILWGPHEWTAPFDIAK